MFTNETEKSLIRLVGNAKKVIEERKESELKIRKAKDDLASFERKHKN